MHSKVVVDVLCSTDRVVGSGAFICLTEETFIIVVSTAYVKWPRIWLENIREW